MADGRQEPLLRVHQGAGTTAAAADAARADGGFRWQTMLGFLFLTLNSGMAIYRSRGDRSVVAFVAFSYMDLLLLFCCLRLFERAVPGSSTRERLKMAVWLLTTLLTAAFFLYKYKATAIIALLGGFYALFFGKDRKRKAAGLLAAFGVGVASAGRRLIADTAASMHAVGDRSLLRDLRLYMTPERVTLPNGTVLRILGYGRIEWDGFRIPNVYLVEGFQKSLISISQLDRDHGMISCFGKGIGEIMLADGITRVGGAFLDDNDNMYVLRFLEVP